MIKIDHNYSDMFSSLMERSRLMIVPLSSLSKDMEPSIMNDSITTSGQLIEKPKEVCLVSSILLRYVASYIVIILLKY